VLRSAEAQANYVQRAGRAGRSTGNALLITMAVSKPHDLFFWGEPKEMMAGSVGTGRVLECIGGAGAAADCLHAGLLGARVWQVGGDSGRDSLRLQCDSWPGDVEVSVPVAQLFVEQHRGELLDRFVRLFNQADRNPLSETTEAWLSKFINGSNDEPGSLGWKIIDKLNGIAKDVDELKRQRERTAKEVDKLQAHGRARRRRRARVESADAGAHSARRAWSAASRARQR
jgi:DEAD/DEAH box helicase domain-containing protein